ncbi:MAG: carotenoid oxygenase family protein [Polyangiales bacterium]
MSQAVSTLTRFQAVPAVHAQPALDRAPFRWTARNQDQLPVQPRGELPSWLSGQLVRTAPAVFETEGWRAAHWFDGLGLMYGFNFGPQGVTFRQRLLASKAAQHAAAGGNRMGSFGTPMKRSFFQRLVQPAPPLTDNTNVNVVPWQGAWLAMTETPAQHVIGSDDMATRGLYEYQDELPKGMNTTAHPHYDFVGNALVNLGTTFGPKSEISVFRQGPHDKARTLEGKLAFSRTPYLHDFGVTARHVVLIEHPLRVNALSLLWTDRPFIERFKWQPETGTFLHLFDRKRGSWTRYETETLFCFHVVNTFEQGDDVVFDFVAFDDASVIDALTTDKLARGKLPNFAPRYVRARLRPGAKRVELEQLSNVGFDFPAINYARVHGRPYRYAWGLALHDATDGWRSEVVRLDREQPEVRRFSEPDVTYGEPVFVPRPGAQEEDDGVLLSVGSHLREDRATLAVIDARTMEALAHCDVELALPLGFHGNFRAL